METSGLPGFARGASVVRQGLKPGLSPSDIHVLVVDDEQFSRTVVSSLLRKCSYTVTTAESGAEALELLQQQPPGTYQLVLTDLCMPEVNGMQVLQYVRGEHTLRGVPVVMMSSIEQGDTVYECVQGGAEEYLVKPVTKKEAQRIWQHVLRKRNAAATVPQAPAAAVQAAAAEAAAAVAHAQQEAEAVQRLEQQQQQQQEQQKASLLALAVPQPAAAAPATARALPAASARLAPDYESAAQFLRLIYEARAAEAAALERKLQALDDDAASVAARLPRKRPREEGAASSSQPDGWEHVSAHMPRMEPLFFQRRQEQRRQGDGNDHLSELGKDLALLSRGSALVPKASVRCGSLASPQEMVCCADFDADDRHVATVSVSRCIKVFDFADILASPDALHFPSWLATTRSKLSSVSWSSYVRQHLVTSDYDGLVQLWDVSAGPGAEAAQFDEHTRRVWSVDYSRLDPLRFASGSDDGTVRIWSTNQEASGLRIAAPANVCSVQFSPTSPHLIAAGCANHRVYLYDLRRAAEPAATIAGARRAVSYVRFMDGGAVAAASTDSAVRLWSVEDALSAREAPAPLCTFSSHTNERNFVGLAVSADGYVACGSEDHSLHAYYRTMPFSIAQYSLGGGTAAGAAAPGGSKARHFVSSVTWARSSRHCLVASSQGLLQVLKLE